MSGVAVATVVVALGWLVLPGLLVGAALRLRGWLLLGVAPALTYGVVGGASLVFSTAGVGFAPLPVALAVLVVTAVAALATRAWQAGEPLDETLGTPRWERSHHVGVGLLVLAAGAIGGRSFVAATGRLEVVNQTWDAFQHGAFIRLIADGGDASPAALKAVTAPAATSYIAPDTYHAVGALTLDVTGAPVPVVINAMAALLPLLFAAGIVALVRATTSRPAHAAAAALLSATVAAVPYHMIGYGTLLPYGTTLVMLPGVVALVAVTLRAPRPAWAVALGVAVAGLFTGHPQVAFLAGIVVAVQVAWHVVGERRVGVPLLRAAAIALVVFVALGFAMIAPLFTAAGGASGIDWPAYTTAGGAVGDLLLFNAASRFPQVWLAPLLFLGLWAVLRHAANRSLRPLLVAATIIAGLFVLAAAYDTPLSLRVTSIWWNDRHRLAAAFAIIAIVVAATGLVLARDAVVRWLAPRLRARADRADRTGRADEDTDADRAGRAGLAGRVAEHAGAGVLALALAAFLVVTGGGYGTATIAAVAEGYPDGPTLSAKERAGLDTVARLVAEGGGGRVMNDPHDGCGWLYALHGTQVVFPTPLTGPFDWSTQGPEREKLYDDFDEQDDDAEARADAAALDVRWAALCTGYVRDFQRRIPGLDRMNDLTSAELVWSNGAVQLWRVDEPTTGS